jgi:hypothetical protein
MHKCTKCGIIQEYSQFSINNHGSVYKNDKGQCISPHCKTCKKSYRKINLLQKPKRSKEQSRLANLLRVRTRKAIKNQNAYKTDHMEKLLGCTFDEVKIYLEKQFLPGMTWENHGLHGWHIDHVRPCASFDLTDSEQQKLCFHYTNLQPLWAKDNLSKNAKWNQPT